MPIKYSIAVDENNNKIEIDKAKPNNTYYCPFCGKKVIAKNNGKIREHHFAHKDVCTETWNYDNKTEWHKHWQSLFPNCSEELVRKGNETHIADVLVNDNVIEFQHSPMTINEFRERNEFYSSLGFKVVWVFDLIEKVDKGYININENKDWISNYKYSKSPIRDMEMSKEKATVFIQTNKIENDNETKVLHQIIDGNNNFSKFSSDEDNVLTPMEFKEIIVGSSTDFTFNKFTNKFITNKCEDNKPFIFEKEREKQPFKFGPTTLNELWNTSYYSLIAENIKNGERVYLRGTDGYVDRDDFGNIYGFYSKFNSHSFNFDKKCPIRDADKPIWVYIKSEEYNISYNMSLIMDSIRSSQRYNREVIHWERMDRRIINKKINKNVFILNDLLKKFKGYSNWFVAECLSNNELFFFKYETMRLYRDRFIDYCNVYVYSNNKSSYLYMFPVNDYVRYELNRSEWRLIHYKPIYRNGLE